MRVVGDGGEMGVVLDTGALLAIERGSVVDHLWEARDAGLPIFVSAGAIAQAWRGGPRAARLAALLKTEINVVELTVAEARKLGEFISLSTRKGTRPDVVDAHVALIALESGGVVLTSDPDDLERYGVPPERLVRV